MFDTVTTATPLEFVETSLTCDVTIKLEPDKFTEDILSVFNFVYKPDLSVFLRSGIPKLNVAVSEVDGSVPSHTPFTDGTLETVIEKPSAETETTLLKVATFVETPVF